MTRWQIVRPVLLVGVFVALPLWVAIGSWFAAYHPDYPSIFVLLTGYGIGGHVCWLIYRVRRVS